MLTPSPKQGCALSLSLGLLLLVTAAVLLTRPSPASARLVCNSDTFLYACAYGDLDKVKRCLEAGSEPYFIKDDLGCPAIAVAARGGHGDVVDTIYYTGVSLNAACDNGQDAIALARLNGHNDLADRLLRLGTKPKNAPLEGAPCSVLEWGAALRSDNINAAENCLLHGMAIETKIDAGCSALTVAAINRHERMVRFLLHRGAAVDARCHDDTTPLMHAAKNGQLEIAKQLVAAGADIELYMAHSRFSALTFAANNGHFEVAKFIHRLEEDFREKEWEGGPLMWAAASGETNLIKSMLKSPRKVQRDLHRQDEHGQTAVMWAAMNGHLATMILLVRYGGTLDTASKIGWTPLMAAAYNGHIAVVEYLIRNDADLNAHDNGGWTAVMWATVNGQYEVVDRLVEEGAELKGSFSGWSCILVSCATGQKDIFNRLLRAGEDMYAELEDGRTCEDVARERGHAGLADHIKGVRAAHQQYRTHEEL